MNGKWVEIEDTDGDARLVNIGCVAIIDDAGDYSRVWLQDDVPVNVVHPSYSELRSMLIGEEAAANGN